MALVLSRRIGESVMMTNPDTGEQASVTILGVFNNQVKLGFVAPQDVVIDREEIHKLKQR